MSGGVIRERTLVANARMYAVDAHVASLWVRLFRFVADASDVPLDVIAHAPPRPLAALWTRSDLGCAFMCGYPFATWDEARAPRPRILAAPLPSPARYGLRPVYCSDIVVRADSAFAGLASLADARFGYTVEHSQSGYQAARALFAPRARAVGGRFFRAVVGPLHTPRAAVEALLADRIDAAPIDSWWHDLLRLHEPKTAAQLRTLASTPPTPLPPLVCAAGVPLAARKRLTTALLRAGNADEVAPLRAPLLLAGFDIVEAASYAALADDARAIDALGYARLA